MPDLSKGQQMMVDDGFPPELLLTQEQRKADWKGVRLTKPMDLKAKPKQEDPATTALRKEIAKADERKKAERLARLRELREQHKPKEADMAAKKAKRRAAAKKPAANQAKAPKQAKAAQENSRTPVVNEVVARIAKMMQRKNGASMEEMVKETGVEAHPMRAKIKQVRDKLGLKTEAPSKDNGFRYYIRGGGEGSAPAEQPAE